MIPAAATASARTDLATRAIKAAKNPLVGTRKATGTGAATAERYVADLDGFEVFRRALAEQPETAPLNYAALPIALQGYPELDAPELTPRGAAVLKPLAQGIKVKLTAWGRRILLAELARWPWRAGCRTEDLRLLRDCSLAFFDDAGDFFTAFETARDSFDSLDWNAFQAQKLSDEEYAYLLVGLLRLSTDAGVSARVTDLAS